MGATWDQEVRQRRHDQRDDGDDQHGYHHSRGVVCTRDLHGQLVAAPIIRGQLDPKDRIALGRARGSQACTSAQAPRAPLKDAELVVLTGVLLPPGQKEREEISRLMRVSFVEIVEPPVARVHLVAEECRAIGLLEVTQHKTRGSDLHG